MANSLYPLRFRPLLKRYIWGGRRLETHLGKPLGEGQTCAESWEVCDHGPDQSVVAAGPLQGSTLGELTREHGAALLGRDSPRPSFPLLWKFLDAKETLSVQVHPDDDRAARLTPPELGKTEAWVVLATDPGGTIYSGLNPGVDRRLLQVAIAEGTCAEVLHQFQPQVGDCVHLPAGAVHALGAGLLVAEIQQASDTTYRLFDWNRPGPDGQPPDLHIEQGLEAIDFGLGQIDARPPHPTGTPGVDRLVECDKFVLDRWEVDSRVSIGGDDRFHIISVIDGEAQIEGDPSDAPVVRGCTTLLPAGIGPVALDPKVPTVLLNAFLP